MDLLSDNKALHVYLQRVIATICRENDIGSLSQSCLDTLETALILRTDIARAYHI